MIGGHWRCVVEGEVRSGGKSPNRFVARYGTLRQAQGRLWGTPDRGWVRFLVCGPPRGRLIAQDEQAEDVAASFRVGRDTLPGALLSTQLL